MMVMVFGLVGFVLAIVINEFSKIIKEKRQQKKLAARAAARRPAK